MEKINDLTLHDITMAIKFNDHWSVSADFMCRLLIENDYKDFDFSLDLYTPYNDSQKTYSRCLFDSQIDYASNFFEFQNKTHFLGALNRIADHLFDTNTNPDEQVYLDGCSEILESFYKEILSKYKDVVLNHVKDLREKGLSEIFYLY